MTQQRLVIITDEPDDDLTAQLLSAAETHNLEAVIVPVCGFDFVNPPVLSIGDLLYRVAITHAACVIEQHLIHPGVATCYTHAAGAFNIWDNQTLMLSRHGIPTPRTFHVMTTDRTELRRRVDALGGLPVVLKVPGRSLGVGVVRVDTWPTLFSVAEALESAHGSDVHLMSCVEPAKHWRLLVVAGEVVASYINEPQDDDFRTCVDESDKAAFTTMPPQEAINQAVAACNILEVEFGGVDILEHTSGRCYLLEVNFPCYFGHPFNAVGTDVAGALVEHLKQKGQQLIEQLAS